MRTLKKTGFTFFQCLVLSGLCYGLLLSSPTLASSDLDKRKAFVLDVCKRIQAVSIAQNIPEAFLARLIWKESRFDPNAVSPKGAMGIAQFMPGTANLRGLDDPFNPHKAIAASASYLIDLRSEFGNWGLAAAGYNAGPGRVAKWLSGQSGLPFETQDFVSSITGLAAEEWRSDNFKAPKFSLSKEHDFLTACQKFPTRYSLYKNASLSSEFAPVKAWGVHLTAHFERSRALNSFRRLQKKFPSVLKSQKPSVVRKVNRSFGNRPRHNIQIGAASRAEANKFCNKLKRAGGICLVQKN